MKASILFLVSCAFTFALNSLLAQNFQGSVIYEEVVKIDLSGQEEIDPAMKQLLAQLPPETSQDAKMLFHDGGYSYEQLPRTGEDASAESGGMNIKITYANDNPEVWHFDRANGKVAQMRNIMNRQFQVADDAFAFDWQLSEETDTDANSALPVKKATAINPAGDTITAWYTTSIPLPYGPRDYAGLPGLIVKVVNDNREYRVKELNLATEKPELTIPYESGKTISLSEYTKMREKKMADVKKGMTTKIIRMN